MHPAPPPPRPVTGHAEPTLLGSLTLTLTLTLTAPLAVAPLLGAVAIAAARGDRRGQLPCPSAG